MKRFVLLCVLFVNALFVLGQTTRQMWVGETFKCEVDASGMGFTSDVSWSVSGGYYSWSGSGFYRDIQVTQYFSGTMSVTCSWNSRYYPSDQWRPQSRTWYFTCLSNPLILRPSYMELEVGDVASVTFGHEYNNNPYASFAQPYVQSSDQSVVKVDANTGRVLAVGPGETYITAYSKLSGNSPYCRVVVKKVDPTSVSIPDNLTTYVKESSDIKATLYPQNSQSTLTWHSDDSQIAEVNNGVVSGKSEGVTNVYVTTANGLRSNNCEVIVKYRVPNGISVNKPSLYLPINHREQLKANVTPNNAKYTLTWSSEDEDIVEVSEDGLVTAKSAGTAAVKVTTDNGYKAQCVVTVPPMPEQLKFPAKVLLQYGKSRTLKCLANPADAYLSLKWSSSHPEIVSVNQSGMITALKPGEADILVEAEGGLTAKCQVLADEPKHCFVLWLRNGQRFDYSLKDHPVVTHEGEDLVLSTQNVKVVYPDSLVWKYTLEDQTTDPYPTDIEMPSFLTLPYKQTQQLAYQLLPSDFDIETQLTWQSSAPHIVSVDATGRLLARCNGEALITVTATNGTKASCRVIVPDVPLFLVVWTADGGRVLYPLNEQPSIHYDVSGCYVVKTSVLEVQYPVADVRMFTLSDSYDPKPDEPMDIPNVTNKENFSFTDDVVTFSGLKSGSVVKVYNISGVLLNSLPASADGDVRLNLSNLPQGIYIIQSERITHKIIKK